MQHRTTRSVRGLAIASFCAVASSCARDGDNGVRAPLVAQFADSTSSRVTYTALRDVETLGAFTLRDIRESSAAVRSWSASGVFWTLNDSGNDERLFAFDSSGRDLGAVTVLSASNRDWEALATGPCAAGRCLYIGEVGDNQARHDHVTIYRIPEPVPPGPGAIASSDDATALRFRYPDGPRDVEAIWVDADTAVWLATKRPIFDVTRKTRPSQVYRLGPELWMSGEISTATLVDSLPNFASRDRRTQITDAALSNPFGELETPSRLAVRTYGMVYVFEVEGTSGRPRRLLGHCNLETLNEKQGEGITWISDDRLLFSSEKSFAPLLAARCP